MAIWGKGEDRHQHETLCEDSRDGADLMSNVILAFWGRAKSANVITLSADLKSSLQNPIKVHLSKFHFSEDCSW